MPFEWLPGGVENGDPDGFVERTNREMADAAKKQLREQGKLFADTFGTSAGLQLLEHLRDRTIEVPLLVVNGVVGSSPEIGMGPAEWAYYREGQNSVIRYIETMIRHAQAPDNEEPNDV